MADENFYEGAMYSMEPGSDSLYTGTSLPQGSIGGTTSVQTANQITEVTNLLNSGMKSTEVSILSPEVFEMIPKQHLKEINRLTKLTGTDTTFHAPAIEPSGFTQQGWNEENRKLNERQLSDTVIRAANLSPDKPMPVTIHASVIPGSETMPSNMFKPSELTPEEKVYVEKHKEVPTQMIAVNQDTGQMMPMIREKVFGPREPKGEIWTPQQRIENANNTQWIKQVTDLTTHKKLADDVIRNLDEDKRQLQQINSILTSEQASQIPDQEKAEMRRRAQGLQQNIGAGMHKAHLLLNDTMTNFRSPFEQAAKYTKDEKSKEALDLISKEWKNMNNEINERFKAIPKDLSKEQKEILRLEALNSVQSKIMDRSLEVLDKGVEAPELFKPVESFAKEKASETFANVAFNAFKKHGDKAPFVSIENPPYGQAMSRAKDLKNLIKESRDKFAKKAMKEKGLSESEAKRAAEMMIGATWDTSHSSMMRKQGFKQKDLTKEAEVIAPFVKHVHLNDNFGYTHTDLPPGMGNVPIKEIVEKFKKKGYKGKHVFEGGNFFQHFKTSPHAMVLQGVGAPIFSGEGGGPSWTQTYGVMGTYSGGYGPFLPSQHHSTYGAGFSGLPTELGGQVASNQSRFAGAPNQ